MKHLFPFFLILALLSFTACSSDDDNQEAPSTEANLTSKRWVFTELKVSSLLGEVDYYATFEDCQRDDFMEFKSGGVLIVDEGSTKCDPGSPQQVRGTWSLQGNMLTISGINFGLPMNSIEIEITESTNTVLKGTFGGTYSGFSFTGNMALRAQ